MSDKLFTIFMSTPSLFLWDEQDGSLGEVTLADFLWQNKDGFLEHTTGEIVEALETTGFYYGGGGSAPHYALTCENRDPFAPDPCAVIYKESAGVTHTVEVFDSREEAMETAANTAHNRLMELDHASHGAYAEELEAVDEALRAGNLEQVLERFNYYMSAEETIFVADTTKIFHTRTEYTNG